MKKYYINGAIVPATHAVIGINDLGFLRGYGIFDFFRIYKGTPLFIEDHLDRFERSAATLSLTIPYSRKKIYEEVMRLVKANEMVFGGIKMILTGGYSEDGFTPGTPNFVMTAGTLPVFPDSYFDKGIKLMMYQYTRDTPYTKSLNYLVPISIQKEIREAEAFDVLYHDGQYISESARSNFFIVDHHGTIVTPDKDALKGITRKQILKIAQAHFNVEIRPLSIQETFAAREAFITSSAKGVMPVRQLDFRRINEGKIGSTTRRISQLFQQHVEQYIHSAITV